MDRKPDNFTLINRYLNQELTEPEARELEREIASNPGLAAELKFHLEVEQAVQEQDIASLRDNMNRIVHHQNPDLADDEFIMSEDYSFELAEELTSLNNLKASLKFDDIINFNHTFPKIHLYQHLLAAKENIYQFYKEQQDHIHKNDFESFTPDDDALFEEIQDALTENDVLDLRANLKQIASNVSHYSYSSNDLQDYVDGTMDPELINRLEEDLVFDKSLENEILLYKEIDFAIGEKDVMDLRASLREIKESAPIFNSGLEEIEGYLYNELSEQQLALFEDELIHNKHLYSEVDLVKGIDQAIQENDIMQLRNNLMNIAEENNNKKQKEQSITGRLWYRRTAISVAAACIILLLGVTGIMRYTSDDNIYRTYYSRYETAGISRSSSSISDETFAKALQKYNKEDYESALKLLQEVLSKDQNNVAGHFYSAVSLQELGRYNNAIKEYEIVVADKDNLFMEQAQWYIGLCYLQTNDEKKAIQQFKKIADGKGYYQEKAVAILRKMKNNI
ncbi:MAG: tetratricopeptide repeat protein [Candidatus Saccharibacteria bacterium]